MSGWFIFLLIVVAAILYLFILVRNYMAKERASENRINVHLGMLSEGYEDLSSTTQDTNTNDASSIPPDVKKLWGYPPQKDTVLEEITNGENVTEGWDYSLKFHEGIIQYLGTDHFNTLEKRFGSIPGIERCLLKTDTIFMISSTSFPREIVIELIWREFLHVAEIASIQQ